MYNVLTFLFVLPCLEEVILNEDRTTEEERRYIMEARKRALQKRKKLRTLGKSRSTESEDEEMEEEEGKKLLLYKNMPTRCKIGKYIGLNGIVNFIQKDLSKKLSPKSH